MMIKMIAGISLFALVGAAVGYSKILCAGGECAITGTPYGGAVFGGVLGMAVMSSIGGIPTTGPSDATPKDEADSEGKSE